MPLRQFQPAPDPMSRPRTTRISVVVLGDVGRSPRMQYHALSLSQLNGTDVMLVGLEGEPCIEAVQRRVHVAEISDVETLKGFPWVIRAPFRASVNAAKLFFALIKRGRTELIVVQNPPAIPTLAVCTLAAWYTGAYLVIDWHNLGFKMLEHNNKISGERGKEALVKIARLYEKWFARMGDGHMCVTKALGSWLESNFNVKRPHVVYDRPHSEFRRLSDAERLSVLKKLVRSEVIPREIAAEVSSRECALLVSSTSWTPDEDFGLLLDGLRHYVATMQSDSARLVVVITGKGPLKAHYEGKIETFNKEADGKVRVLTAWLSNEDYPLFIGACDLGVSLHISTSGLDLPMKIVDMFGASLPCVAVNFDCLDELVQHGENGLTFAPNDPADLAAKLHLALDGFPSRAELLKRVRSGIVGSFEGWQANWERTALPLVTTLLDHSPHKPRFRGLFSFVSFCILAVLLFARLVLGYNLIQG